MCGGFSLKIMAESIKRKLSKIKLNVLEAVDDGGSSQNKSSVQKKVTAGSKSVIGQWPWAFRREEATKASNNDLISRGERHLTALQAKIFYVKAESV